MGYVRNQSHHCLSLLLLPVPSVLVDKKYLKHCDGSIFFLFVCTRRLIRSKYWMNQLQKATKWYSHLLIIWTFQRNHIHCVWSTRSRLHSTAMLDYCKNGSLDKQKCVSRSIWYIYYHTPTSHFSSFLFFEKDISELGALGSTPLKIFEQQGKNNGIILHRERDEDLVLALRRREAPPTTGRKRSVLTA